MKTYFGKTSIEERRCWVTEEIAWLEQKEEWAKLKSVIMVEAVREVIGKEKSTERRYFISSLGANAAQALRAVRGHWAIENELHWCLDIGFREDDCQVREAQSAENLAAIRHIGLNLLKQEKSCKLQYLRQICRNCKTIIVENTEALKIARNVRIIKKDSGKRRMYFNCIWCICLYLESQ